MKINLTQTVILAFLIIIIPKNGLGQEPEISIVYPVCNPSFIVLAEGDTIWIGETGFIKTDSTCFDRQAFDHWYLIFSQYSDTISFRIVKDMRVLADYQDKSRPTCTDLNDYAWYVCNYLKTVDLQVRVNYGEYCIYDNE